MKNTFALLLAAVMLLCVGPVAFAADTSARLPGDVDGSGKVQAEDARLALRASVGLEKYKSDTAAFTAADVNRDGRVGSDDARSILRASVGLEKLTETVIVRSDTCAEFEYLRGNRYYLRGTMTDSSGQRYPLEMAVTPDSVYMLSDFDGTDMGILIKGKNTYMIYPDGKAYLELSDVVLKAMGMSTSDLIDAGDMDYSEYELNKADAVLTENVNGVGCTVYVYNNSSGSTRFFINGNKLVRFATYTADGRPDTINDVDYITDQVPADKIAPPAGYKKYRGLIGMFAFIRLIEDVIPE